MLIGITGKKGSGKDTLAEVLTKRNFYNLKMAGPLKDMIRTLYRAAGVDEETIERKMEGDLKEVPCAILCGKTPRYAMQKLGEEWRNMIGQQLWTEIWRSKAARLLEDGTPIVCTDIRYQHEADAVNEFAGYLIRVDRPGQDTSDQHVSETEMDSLQVDVTLGNFGSILQLQEKMTKLVGELIDAKI